MMRCGKYTIHKRIIYILSIFLISAAGLVLTGCLQVETNITVRGDGSGTVTRVFLMKEEFVTLLEQMPGKEDFSLLDEEELRAKAADLGRGVRFAGADAYTADGFSGFVAEYSFQDINHLQLDQNPGDNMPSESMADQPVREFVTFTFTKGSPNELTVHMPAYNAHEARGLEKNEDESGIDDTKKMEFIEDFTKIYGDMRVSMRLHVDGRITRTNALYREGNTITLMNIEFSKIVNQPEKLEELAEKDPESLAEMKTIINDIEGMEIELQNPVEILFR